MTQINVHVLCEAWSDAIPDAAAWCRVSARAALEDVMDPVEASVVLVDDDYIRQLNRDYRGRETPTNVLSFSARDGTAGLSQEPEGIQILGDVFVAFETSVREAAASDTLALRDHLSHLVIHGMLHLLGYDHETDADATVMESLEIERLSNIGVANPYDTDDTACRHGVENPQVSVQDTTT